MTKARCHAPDCNRLMKDHTAREHFTCAVRIVKEMGKGLEKI